jgi:arginyl-tRNA synthetase
MPQVVEELKQKNLLKQSQGAQVVDLTEHNLGIAIIIKSDGGTTYLLRDLATFIYRKSQKFSRQLYVVDVRQSHTLAQTFKTLELLDHIQNPQEAVHVAYGFLTLPEGAMSTRKGTAVGAKEFIAEVQQRALDIIKQKNPDLKNKEQVAKEVATAAIKYFDLSHNLKSDIVFKPEEAITFEGNTGPYLQYTHARIHGILRKFNSGSLLGSRGELERGRNKDQTSPSFPPQALGREALSGLELSVLRKLHQFPEVLEQVATEYLPNILCNYLFELSQNFNSFYQAVPVLSSRGRSASGGQEEDDALKSFRLQLVIATAQVIKNGLYLLGIEALEEM